MAKKEFKKTGTQLKLTEELNLAYQGDINQTLMLDEDDSYIESDDSN